MKENSFIKILASIPIILIILYFIPFLGVCLLILRYFVYSSKKKTSTSIILFSIGILLLVPKILKSILGIAKIKIDSIPFFNTLITSDLYNVDLIKFSKLLITVGVIFFILSFVWKKLFNKISDKVSSGARDYITKTENRNAEILKANDMEMREKREKAKHTGYVRCPYCGGDNIVSEKTGKCKYCRRLIENPNFKG